MKKLYPSAISFFKDGEVHTKSNTGCLRKLLIDIYIVKPEFPDIFRIIGEKHEHNTHGRLIKVYGDENILVENSVTKEIITDKLLLSGRTDFDVIGGPIVESKSTANKHMRTNLKKGKINYNHLAQLVTYFLMKRKDVGILDYGFYQYAGPDTDEIVCTYQRSFEVTLTNKGGIMVDGELTPYNISHVYDYIQIAEEVLNDGVIAERPYIDIDKYGVNPCKYCSYSESCDIYDNCGGNKDKFIINCMECRLKIHQSEQDLWRPKREVKDENIIK